MILRSIREKETQRLEELREHFLSLVNEGTEIKELKRIFKAAKQFKKISSLSTKVMDFNSSQERQKDKEKLEQEKENLKEMLSSYDSETQKAIHEFHYLAWANGLKKLFKEEEFFNWISARNQVINYYNLR